MNRFSFSSMTMRRLWREIRLYKIAPEQMVLSYLSEHVLGLPKSY